MNDFESYLESKVSENIPGRTKEAMKYSLMNGGKRIRPQLLFAMLSCYGMDETIGYPCACAIEMIHTYSLIHDDLPAMDDDDLRRGKPSCHKAFDEACAILAGDGLLTKAFEVVLETNCDASKKVELVKALSQYAGIDGMIYGQELDIQSENNDSPSLELLLSIDEYKTAKLLSLPLVCGCIIAGKDQDIEIAKKLGLNIGIQFQMVDDILDVTQSQEVLGKSTSDIENKKVTAVSLLGLDAAKKKVQKYKQELEFDLKKLDGNTEKLESIFNYLVNRTY